MPEVDFSAFSLELPMPFEGPFHANERQLEVGKEIYEILIRHGDAAGRNELWGCVCFVCLLFVPGGLGCCGFCKSWLFERSLSTLVEVYIDRYNLGFAPFACNSPKKEVLSHREHL